VPIQSIEGFPPSGDSHHWADYAELLCLVNIDGTLSEADLISRWQKRKGMGGEPIAEDDDEALEPPARSDRISALAADVYRQLEYRAGLFGPAYPFRVREMEYMDRVDDISSLQKIYLFLLLASSLRCLDRRGRTAVTVSFERLCQCAIAAWLPSRARVRLFGTGGKGEAGEYEGTLYQRLVKLAGDLSEELIAKESDFRAGDYGDGGIDIAAWVPFMDWLPSQLILLAQATCENDWTHKQHEAGQAKISSRFRFVAPHTTALCIPYCFRSPSGEWFKQNDIHQTVLLDRFRILSLMPDAELPLSLLPAAELDSALEYREAPV